MKKNRLIVQILAAVFIVSFLGAAGAAEPTATVFPKGVVYVTEGSHVIPLKTNFPLKPGSIMETSGGPATVQGPNFSFEIQDNSRFSLNNAGGKWVCTVYSGKANYVLHSDSAVTFVHADRVYDCQRIAPSTPGGSVEGTVALDGDKLVFANTAGELVLAPTFAGVDPAPMMVAPAAGAEGLSATSVAVGAGFAATAAGTGAGLGLTSGHSSSSPQ